MIFLSLEARQGIEVEAHLKAWYWYTERMAFARKWPWFSSRKLWQYCRLLSSCIWKGQSIIRLGLGTACILHIHPGLEPWKHGSFRVGKFAISDALTHSRTLWAFFCYVTLGKYSIFRFNRWKIFDSRPLNKFANLPRESKVLFHEDVPVSRYRMGHKVIAHRLRWERGTTTVQLVRAGRLKNGLLEQPWI